MTEVSDKVPEGWAMRVPRRSAGLRAEPCFASRRYRAAAAIASGRRAIAARHHKREREVFGTAAVILAVFAVAWFAAHFIGWSGQ